MKKKNNSSNHNRSKMKNQYFQLRIQVKIQVNLIFNSWILLMNCLLNIEKILW